MVVTLENPTFIWYNTCYRKFGFCKRQAVFTTIHEVNVMDKVIIKNAELDKEVGGFINKEFTAYGLKCAVELNFKDFCFAAYDDEKNIIGVIAGIAYYNEVHIDNLVVAEGFRSKGLGSRLVGAVEEAFSGKGYDLITLTTFGFQAPEFYPKLGYEIEYVRKDKDPKLSKYFLFKKL